MRQLIAATLLLTLAAGCADSDRDSRPATTSQGSQTSDPREQVVEMLTRAVEAGDCDQVLKLVLTPSDIDCGSIVEASGMLAAEGIDVDDVRYEAGEVAGDSSTVLIKWGKGFPAEPTDVQRVDGHWLVVFDPVA